MIWESWFWKRDLINDAGIIHRWSKKKCSIRQEVLIEKKIFISAYSIRKLIEAEKIGPDFPMWNFTVNVHAKISNNPIDHLNNHRLDQHYDFSNSSNKTICLSELFNQIIHSYVFFIVRNGNNITGFYVSSDHEKEKTLYYIDIEKYINLLIWIGHSTIASALMIRNPSKKSGFDFKREYAFNDCIPRKGLPKVKLLFVSDMLSEEYNST